MTRNGLKLIRVSLAAMFLLTLAACDEAQQKPKAEPRPVRTVEAVPENMATGAQGTGLITARYITNVGFLVGGRLIERNVDVGSIVKTGDIIARLDPSDQINKLTSAQSQVEAMLAIVKKTSAQEERLRKLLADGYTTRAKYDEAESAYSTARAQLDDARAQRKLAEDQLAHTELHATSDGIVTEIGAEPGQVVQPGQMVVQISQPSEREAVFSVAETQIAFARPGMSLKVWLQSNPDISTIGSIREIAPNADPVTRTYTLKVSLPDAPPAMRLGAVIVGRAEILAGQTAIRVPPTALIQTSATPAVWVVSRDGMRVHRHDVTVLRYDTDSVLISSGIEKGDLIVTAGVNLLAEGQEVKLLPEAAK